MEGFTCISKYFMKYLFPNKNIDGSMDISINSSHFVSVAIQFNFNPDTSSLWVWILWPRAQKLKWFETNPRPGPNLEMGHLQALRKQAHPVWSNWLPHNSRAWHLRSSFSPQIPFASKGGMLGRRERSHKKQMTNCKRQQLDSACSANTHLIKSIFFPPHCKQPVLLTLNDNVEWLWGEKCLK